MRSIYSFFACFFLQQLNLGFAHVNDKLYSGEVYLKNYVYKLKGKKYQNREMPFSTQEQYLTLQL